jgi:hypothetical protein
MAKLQPTIDSLLLKRMIFRALVGKNKTVASKSTKNTLPLDTYAPPSSPAHWLGCRFQLPSSLLTFISYVCGWQAGCEPPSGGRGA